MPPELDPAWEYWTPDPEIEELLGPPGWDVLGSILDHRQRDGSGRVSGFRFGRRPDGKTHLGPGRKRPEAAPELAPVTCTCGYTFRPTRPGNRYCSRACVVHPKRLPVIPCGGCRREFRPKYGRQAYCSRACAPKAGGVRVLPDYLCPTCRTWFRPTCSRRKVCSPACVRNKGAARKIADRPCEGCKAVFRPDRSSRIYCSSACRWRKGVPCRS